MTRRQLEIAERFGIEGVASRVIMLEETLEQLAVHSDTIESLSNPASVVSQSLRTDLRRARLVLGVPAKEA